jgi:hypothetical protein
VSGSSKDDTRSPRDRTPAALAADEVPATLTEQFGRTRGSFSRLFRAHVDLLKAEIGEIMGQIKTIGTLAGVALAFTLMVGNLLYIGGFLFLGEWLFGSIGWGLAHGVLFGLDMVVVLVLAILGARMVSAIISYLLATAIAVGIALLCGLNIAYDAAASVAAGLSSPLNGAGVVAAAVGALVGALLFALMFWRLMGGGGAIVGLILGIILGAPVGWLIGGAPWTWPPAVGFAVTMGLIAWPILNAVLAVPGLDPGARFSKLYPHQSIEAANETKAWLEEQWRRRQPKLGRK